MIVVHADGDTHEFAAATRFSTDEHNNLCIWTGRLGDKLTHLFADKNWQVVEVDDDAS